MDLHPFFTHFPIALLIAVVLLEVRNVFRTKLDGEDSIIGWLLWMAVGMTVVAFYSGLSASDSANQTFVVSDEYISTHFTWGRFLLFAAPMTAVLQLAFQRAQFNRGLFRGLYLSSLIIAMLLALVTGYHGGELVFRHGAGVSATLPIASPLP